MQTGVSQDLSLAVSVEDEVPSAGGEWVGGFRVPLRLDHVVALPSGGFSRAGASGAQEDEGGAGLWGVGRWFEGDGEGGGVGELFPKTDLAFCIRSLRRVCSVSLPVVRGVGGMGLAGWFGSGVVHDLPGSPLAVGKEVCCMSASEDGAWLAAGLRDGSVMVWCMVVPAEGSRHPVQLRRRRDAGLEAVLVGEVKAAGCGPVIALSVASAHGMEEEWVEGMGGDVRGAGRKVPLGLVAVSRCSSTTILHATAPDASIHSEEKDGVVTLGCVVPSDISSPTTSLTWALPHLPPPLPNKGSRPFLDRALPLLSSPTHSPILLTGSKHGSLTAWNIASSSTPPPSPPLSASLLAITDLAASYTHSFGVASLTAERDRPEQQWTVGVGGSDGILRLLQLNRNCDTEKALSSSTLALRGARVISPSVPPQASNPLYTKLTPSQSTALSLGTDPITGVSLLPLTRHAPSSRRKKSSSTSSSSSSTSSSSSPTGGGVVLATCLSGEVLLWTRDAQSPSTEDDGGERGEGEGGSGEEHERTVDIPQPRQEGSIGEDDVEGGGVVEEGRVVRGEEGEVEVEEEEEEEEDMIPSSQPLASLPTPYPSMPPGAGGIGLESEEGEVGRGLGGSPPQPTEAPELPVAGGGGKRRRRVKRGGSSKTKLVPLSSHLLALPRHRAEIAKETKKQRRAREMREERERRRRERWERMGRGGGGEGGEVEIPPAPTLLRKTDGRNRSSAMARRYASLRFERATSGMYPEPLPGTDAPDPTPYTAPSHGHAVTALEEAISTVASATFHRPQALIAAKTAVRAAEKKGSGLAKAPRDGVDFDPAFHLFDAIAQDVENCPELVEQRRTVERLERTTKKLAQTWQQRAMAKE